MTKVFSKKTSDHIKVVIDIIEELNVVCNFDFSKEINILKESLFTIFDEMMQKDITYTCDQTFFLSALIDLIEEKSPVDWPVFLSLLDIYLIRDKEEAKKRIEHLLELHDQWIDEYVTPFIKAKFLEAVICL